MARLTLSDVCATLLDVVSTGGDDDSKFLPLLNQVQERLFTMGRWPGMEAVLVFDASAGYITLPRGFGAALGAQITSEPAAIFGRLHEFSLTGPGELTSGFSSRLLADMGDGYCAALDIPNASTLRVESSSVLDTEALTLSDTANGVTEDVLPGDTSTGHFSSLDNVLKPVTVGTVKLYAVSVATSVETLIATYAPGETNPSYRRYRVTGTDPTETLRLLCKREYIPCTADSDPVIPANIGALKQGLLALNYEDSGDIARANASWANALEILQGGVRQERGGILMTAKMRGLGTGRMRSML